VGNVTPTIYNLTPQGNVGVLLAGAALAGAGNTRLVVHPEIPLAANLNAQTVLGGQIVVAWVVAGGAVTFIGTHCFVY
jgi:hypothetical protein